ncbi:MAG: c-type cytochrome [Bradyrhizobium sp.]
MFIVISLSHSPTAARFPPHQRRRDVRILWAAGGLDLASTTGWLLATSTSLGDSWNELCGRGGPLALDSQATGSNALVIHLVLVVAFIAAANLGNDRLRLPLLIFCAFEASCALGWVGSTVWVGESFGSVPLVLDVVYKIASGLWLGLFTGLLSLTSAMRAGSIDDVGALDDFLRCKVIPMAACCAVVLLACEAGNAILFAGDIPRLIGTDYGRLIVAALLLIAAMLVVTVRHLRLLRSGRPRSAASLDNYLMLLRRSCTIAVALGSTAIAIPAILAAMHPASHQEPLWPLPIRLETDQLAEALMACLLSIAGIGLLATSIVRRRLRLLSGLIGLMLLFIFIPAASQLMAVPAYPTTFQYPPPPYDTISIEQGWQTYRNNCAACHGLDFKGSGEAGMTLAIRPADLTASHVLAHPPGDLFWRISNGIPGTAMPGFAPSLSEADRWRLVDFVRVLPDNGVGESIGPNGTPAPDFAFGLAAGQRDRLRNRIARGPLLLAVFEEPTVRANELAAARQNLEKSGLGLLVVTATPEPGGDASPVGIVDQSVTSVYCLLSKSPPPCASEFLIDSSGAVRAIWRSHQVPDWKVKAVSERLIADLALHPTAKKNSFHAH